MTFRKTGSGSIYADVDGDQIAFSDSGFTALICLLKRLRTGSSFSLGLFFPAEAFCTARSSDRAWRHFCWAPTLNQGPGHFSRWAAVHKARTPPERDAPWQFRLDESRARPCQTSLIQNMLITCNLVAGPAAARGSAWRGAQVPRRTPRSPQDTERRAPLCCRTLGSVAASVSLAQGS